VPQTGGLMKSNYLKSIEPAPTPEEEEEKNKVDHEVEPEKSP